MHWHVVESALFVDPLPHKRQTLCPIFEFADPAGHLMQSAIDFPLLFGLKVPIGQALIVAVVVPEGQ
jgi:hypothetical protein